MVVGVRGERDIASLLTPLRGKVRKVIATQAEDHLAVRPDKVAAAATEALGVDAETMPHVPDAVAAAIASVDGDDGVLIAGSLYVVGEARHALHLDNSPSPVHRRFEAVIEDDFE